MNKHKIRKVFVRILLAFVIFLYIFSIIVFIFGSPQAGIYVFAYSTFFTVIVYFLNLFQKRLENYADKDTYTPENDTNNDDKTTKNS